MTNSDYSKIDLSNLIGYRQVIFISSENNKHIDRVIEQNLSKIKSDFTKINIEFIYLPEIMEKFDGNRDDLKEYSDYCYPFIRNKAIPHVNNLYNQLIQDFNILETNLPCVITNKLSNRLFKIESIKSIDLLIKELSTADKSMDDVVMFRHAFKEKDIQVTYFEDEMDQIAQEVADKIRKIKDPNAFKLFIDLVAQHANKKKSYTLSRLSIDDEYRLFLSDYGNIEIHLTPLQKTVYLFFLNHPEGIMFSDMPKHKNELLSIYFKLSSRDDINNLRLSIDDLVNPESNSLSEKCSKIRSAFLMNIDDTLAMHYYISGERGKKKFIKLNRDLIELYSPTKKLVK